MKVNGSLAKCLLGESEEAGVQSDLIRTVQATFQLSQKFFLGLEDCMFSFRSLFSRSLMYSSPVEELVLTGEVPTLLLGSKTVAEADVVAESAEDMFPSFKCVVFCKWSQEGRKP